MPGILALGVADADALTLEGVGSHVNQALNQLQRAEAVDCAAAEHRGQRALLNRRADAVDNLFVAERLSAVLEVLFHQGLVGLGDGLANHLEVLFSLGLQVARDGHLGCLAVFPGMRGLADHVHVAHGLGAFHDGQHDGNHGDTELLAQSVDHADEIGMLFVHLGDVDEPGQLALLQVTPGLFGADGQAALTGDQHHTGVRDAQGLHHFTGEVEVAGVVEDVQLGFLVFDRENRGGDGITTLNLFLIVVTGRIAVRGLAQTVDALGQEQHALNQRGLAVAAMAQQTNIADVFGLIAHINYSFRTGHITNRSAASAVCHNSYIIPDAASLFNCQIRRFQQSK